MKKIFALLVVCLVLTSCEAQTKTEFTKEALENVMTTIDNKPITFEEIMNKYKGQTIFIDVWASWCSDCIKGLPKLKAVQSQFPEVVYLFLSLDRIGKEEAWKNGIEKFGIEGEHYWFNADWKNDFTNYIGLNWIPRYMLIDREGKIAHYYAIHADDAQMMERLVELMQIPKN